MKQVQEPTGNACKEFQQVKKQQETEQSH